MKSDLVIEDHAFTVYITYLLYISHAAMHFDLMAPICTTKVKPFPFLSIVCIFKSKAISSVYIDKSLVKSHATKQQYPFHINFEAKQGNIVGVGCSTHL